MMDARTLTEEEFEALTNEQFSAMTEYFFDPDKRTPGNFEVLVLTESSHDLEVWTN